MAIEAVRLLMDTSKKTIHRYRLRDIDIMNALRIPDTTLGIETQFYLRPCSEKELDYKGWYEFSLNSISVDDTWIQHCKGYVLAERGSPAPPADNEHLIPRLISTDSDVQAEKVDPESVFIEMRSMNIYHGPAFQNLVDIRSTKRRVEITLNISTAA